MAWVRWVGGARAPSGARRDDVCGPDRGVITRHEDLQRLDLRDRIAVMEDAIELGPRFRCGAERRLCVDLQRPLQPHPERQRQRLQCSVRRQRKCAGRHVADPCREFVFRQRPSDGECQRRSAHLCDIGPAIQVRHAERPRERDAQVLPILLVRVAKLFDRRAEHVLDDHEARMRRHDDALGTDGAVAHVRSLVVQNRNGVNELAQQTERGVHLDGQQVTLRRGEDR